MPKLIPLSPHKPPILKTTILTNFPPLFPKHPKKLLIIHTHTQSNLLLTFPKNPHKINNTLYHLLLHPLPLPHLIINLHQNIHLLPINHHFNYFHIHLLQNTQNYPNKFPLLKQPIPNIPHHYHFLIIHTPPTLPFIPPNLYTYTQQLLIPFHPHIYTLTTLLKTIQSLNNFKHSNPPLKIQPILPTKLKSLSTIHTHNIYNSPHFSTLQHILLTQTYITQTLKYSQPLSSQQNPFLLPHQHKIKPQKFIQHYLNLPNHFNYIPYIKPYSKTTSYSHPSTTKTNTH
ncbi:ParA family protein [Bacillus thuringiensis]|uniref:ParA family protein n=1 Tax=Bacillus thuringiensis TaxID=1428 RepID=UPI0011A7BBBC